MSLLADTGVLQGSQGWSSHFINSCTHNFSPAHGFPVVSQWSLLLASCNKNFSPFLTIYQCFVETLVGHHVIVFVSDIRILFLTSRGQVNIERWVYFAVGIHLLCSVIKSQEFPILSLDKKMQNKMWYKLL